MNYSNNLYVCEKYYLLVYETKEIAAAAFPEGAAREIAAGVQTPSTKITKDMFVEGVAAYWSGVLNSKVAWVQPGEPILFVEKNDSFHKILVGEKIGWIAASEWLNIKPLENKND